MAQVVIIALLRVLVIVTLTFVRQIQPMTVTLVSVKPVVNNVSVVETMVQAPVTLEVAGKITLTTMLQISVRVVHRGVCIVM